ncbi:MAG: hypothetical protein QME51_00650, partial [Planctomycetota bacterium]|nr:hypothetical protein [Planctomycetota bacterium]
RDGGYHSSRSYIDGVLCAELKPLMTPLFISGVNSYRMRYLAGALEKYNFIPLQSGSATSDLKESVSKDLAPGSAVGVALVRGDEEWTGIGTVTYVKGDKILAFGHGMSKWGEEVSAPLTNAYIYGVLSRLSMSVKFGSAVREVGALCQDRRSSISGILKKSVKMLPMKISVQNLKTGRSETFNYEILDHYYVFPDVIPWLMWSAADAVELTPFEPALIEVVTNLKIKDFPAVSFRRLVSDSPSGAGCGAIRNVFNPIWYNPYMKVPVENVSFELRVLNENRNLQILNVWTEAEVKEVLPGETVKVYCRLKPYLKEPFVKTIDVVIPKDLEPPTKVTVTVIGSNSLTSPLPTPTNIPELINYLKSFYDGGNLVAVLTLPDTNLKFRGEVFERLPRSILRGLINQWDGPVYETSPFDTYQKRPSLLKPLELGQDYILTVEPSSRGEYLVSGRGSISINVVKYKHK